MNVQIQAVKFDADRKLIEFVEAKMAKLDRFIERATGAESSTSTAVTAQAA